MTRWVVVGHWQVVTTTPESHVSTYRRENKSVSSHFMNTNANMTHIRQNFKISFWFCLIFNSDRCLCSNISYFCSVQCCFIIINVHWACYTLPKLFVFCWMHAFIFYVHTLLLCYTLWVKTTTFKSLDFSLNILKEL